MLKKVKDQNTWNELMLDLESSLIEIQEENKQLKESLNSILNILKKTLEGVSNEHRNV
mgnify:CR=1 FL=1|tara:strand:+ start:3587 stop:3760 length:174 start_codon:yes stop_codon:yes gene_type:complete